jgi:hypothetical protein
LIKAGQAGLRCFLFGFLSRFLLMAQSDQGGGNSSS